MTFPLTLLYLLSYSSTSTGILLKIVMNIGALGLVFDYIKVLLTIVSVSQKV